MYSVSTTAIRLYEEMRDIDRQIETANNETVGELQTKRKRIADELLPLLESAKKITRKEARNHFTYRG